MGELTEDPISTKIFICGGHDISEVVSDGLDFVSAFLRV